MSILVRNFQGLNDETKQKNLMWIHGNKESKCLSTLQNWLARLSIWQLLVTTEFPLHAPVRSSATN